MLVDNKNFNLGGLIMGQHTCSNPECKKIYDRSDKDSDMDYCSFSWWEKMNCLEPQELQELTLAELG